MTDGEAGGLEHAFEALLRRVVKDSLGAFREELRSVVQQEIAGVSAGFSAATTSQPAAAPAPALAATPAAPPAFGGLNQSLAQILQPSAQAEIMGALLQCAAGYAGRCALFVRRGDSFSFWRAEGFPADAATRLRTLTVPVHQGRIFKEVLESQLAVSSSRSAGTLPPDVQQALGEAVEEAVYLFPVAVQGRLVAALYADAGTAPGSVEPAALEILARVAGLSVETAATRPATGKPAARPAQPSETEPPAPAEAPAAVSVAPAEERPPAIPPPPDPDSLSEEEKDAHRRAHRFARVAVQDLFSYHKDKIEEARRNKNLYLALKEDIDKTRENYQKRFSETPARRFDYLHYELVAKLAANDPEALGQQYPGSQTRE